MMEEIKPKISINMVTYNRAHYIAEAIVSVLAQSFHQWEMIIIDDGSIDNTERIVKDFMDKDDRIKYFKNEKNLGVVRSRNLVLEKSVGKYIAVLDSDDVWCDIEKLRRQFDKLEDVFVLVGSNVFTIDENSNLIKKIKRPLLDKDIRKSILYRNPFAHSSVVFDKEKVLQVGGYRDFRVGEDYDLFLRMGLQGKFCNLEEVMLKYRVHSDNISMENKIKSLESNLEIIKSYKDKYPNYFIAFLRRKFRLIFGKLIFRENKSV